MPIKLTPEHVGTRVLLDNGCIGVVTSYFKTMAGPRLEIAFGIVSLPFSMAIYDDDGIFERARTEHCPRGNTAKWRVVLSLDAPNPLDVEVPEWCEWVIGWRVFDAAPPHLIPAIHGPADFPHDVFGWSPAPGQMPPRVGG
jgi:hypothetical protein